MSKALICLAMIGICMLPTTAGARRSPAIAIPRAACPCYSVVYNFGATGSDGLNPKAPLFYSNGAFYGTTASGGALGYGTVFVLANGMETVLHSFDGSDGQLPYGAVIGANDVLFGTTFGGGANREGTVFSVTKTGSERVLYSFTASPDGNFPAAGLANVGGVLYGTTGQGGKKGSPAGGGTVFAVTQSGAESVRFRFSIDSCCEQTVSGLIALSGVLYGTTSGYRANGGTVFRMTPDGSESVLHDFPVNSRSDGSSPRSNLVALDGVLYGTTSAGGEYGQGTVFSITPAGKETVLHNFGFERTGGIDPYDGLAVLDGVLYGTTAAGGTYNDGTLFKMTTGGAYTVLHTFGSGSDGTNPESSLIAVGGSLYGTTPSGGAYGSGAKNGTIFSYTP